VSEYYDRGLARTPPKNRPTILFNYFGGGSEYSMTNLIGEIDRGATGIKILGRRLRFDQ
jgi:hypothetical protein